MSIERSPTDGQPYYCVKCSMGFGEFMACELPDCELESEMSAELRTLKWDDGTDEQ